jgi:predicted oxidoreductase
MRPPTPRRFVVLAAAACLAATLVACQGEVAQPDADVIVVGGGIAGLSAALEASDAGADVIVVETSSVAGGHAVVAGGFALVGTPLQERKGWTDTPDIAFQDLMAWGEDANADWVRAYVENSRTEVYDWLTALGVKFVVVLNTPEDTVPRFHFTRGTAINVIVPMLNTALDRDNIRLQTNSSAEQLIRTGDAVTGVRISNTRTGATREHHARSVILATGGFQSNLDMVRANWNRAGQSTGDAEENSSTASTARPQPERLLIGSARFADGSGIELGTAAGAGLSRMDHQVTFVNGLPDPRRPAHGLNTQNAAAIWVNAQGRRFVSEAVNSKAYEAAVFAQVPPTHWLIFDAQGRRKLRLRGAGWLTPDTITAEILDAPEVGHKYATIEALAIATGLPVQSLRATVDRYNEFVARGEDADFKRFDTESSSRKPVAIATPPYYALQLLPMTRKSMGGLAIDATGQVLDAREQPIAGLFAAGELTGVAGINGSHGGSGTFLGPSVYTGRVAGRGSVRSLGLTPAPPADALVADALVSDTSEVVPDTKMLLNASQLEALLKNNRPGYWHFEKSHATVLERSYECVRCHSPDWPTQPAVTKLQVRAQLNSCTQCH